VLLTPRAGAGGTHIEALRGGCAELGYVEGESLLEIRSEREAGSSARACCRDSEHSADVLVTRAASDPYLKRANRCHSHHHGTVMDPVALGIPEPRQTGGNLTGLAILSLELTPAYATQLTPEHFPRQSREPLWRYRKSLAVSSRDRMASPVRLPPGLARFGVMPRPLGPLLWP